MKAQALVILALSAFSSAQEDSLPEPCDVRARTEYGMVCGRIRIATDGTKYASFRGIPYARAPRRERRFAPPQKPDSWDGVFNASEAGPVCPQVDVAFGPIFQPVSMDEDCLRLNVHVPLNRLPDPDNESGARRTIPVFAWIHGGSFSYGSGDADLHGQEYFMADQDIAVVTMNYRLNVFGFLTLGTEKVPGNAGLRDAMFALEWIQNNIQFFGGDPTEVTLGGQSAGAAMASLLASSPATKDRNLFKRPTRTSRHRWKGLVRGALPSGQTVASVQIRDITDRGMPALDGAAAGINILQSDDGIYKHLIEAPVDKLIRANKALLDLFGIVTFAPVIEDSNLNITAIIPKDPEILIKEGYGKEYPTLLGFTNNEGETFRQRLREVFIETKLRLLPPLTLPLNLLFSSRLLTIPILTGKQMIEYFNVTFITLDKFLVSLNDGFFKYPTLRLIRFRLATGAEDTYMYQFSYPGQNSVFKEVQGRNWTGAGHVEDQTYIFRVNSILGNNTVNELAQDTPDSKMKKFMIESFVRFIKRGRPANAPLLGRNRWPPSGQNLEFLNIEVPGEYNFTAATPYMVDQIEYFDRLYEIGRGNITERDLLN